MDLDIVLKIFEIASILGGGVIFMVYIGRSFEATNQMVNSLKDVVLAQGLELKELRAEMKQFAAVLTQVAVQKERIDTISQRILVLDSRLDELRRANFPLTRATVPD